MDGIFPHLLIIQPLPDRSGMNEEKREIYTLATPPALKNYVIMLRERL